MTSAYLYRQLKEVKDMKKKILSWLNYISVGIIVQCFVIVQMCNVRGSVEIGGEYLILPAMVMVRLAIKDVLGKER